jgi:hypothetical protein
MDLEVGAAPEYFLCIAIFTIAGFRKMILCKQMVANVRLQA